MEVTGSAVNSVREFIRTYFAVRHDERVSSLSSHRGSSSARDRLEIGIPLNRLSTNPIKNSTPLFHGRNEKKPETTGIVMTVTRSMVSTVFSRGSDRFTPITEHPAERK